MPATYTVSTGRNQQMSFSGTGDSLSITWQQEYEVEVSGVTASSVSPYDVLTATGIPIVNKTIYYDGTNIIPFVVCRSKSAQQNPKRLSRWTVKAQYESANKNNQRESENTPVTPPASLSAFTPRVVPTLGEFERPLLKDKAQEPLPTDVSPSGTRYENPPMEVLPTLRLQITQYESSITYEQMLERKHKVNQNEYRDQERYKWRISEVEAVEVEVQLAGGPATAAQVTYTLDLSPYEWGWKHAINLFDTHYLEYAADGTGPPRRKRFVDEFDHSVGYITSVGTKRDNQFGEPDTITYEGYDDIDFDDFLQV